MEVARAQRAREKLDAREVALNEQMADSASDHGRLRELDEELWALSAERDAPQGAWLEASEGLEQPPR